MAKRMKTFICEGCLTRERDPLGWSGYGTSARFKSVTVAYWCPRCKADGTMKTHAARTYGRAVAAAKSRGVLNQLRRLPQDARR